MPESRFSAEGCSLQGKGYGCANRVQGLGSRKADFVRRLCTFQALNCSGSAGRLSPQFSWCGPGQLRIRYMCTLLSSDFLKSRAFRSKLLCRSEPGAHLHRRGRKHGRMLIRNKNRELGADLFGYPSKWLHGRDRPGRKKRRMRFRCVREIGRDGHTNENPIRHTFPAISFGQEQHWNRSTQPEQVYSEAG